MRILHLVSYSLFSGPLPPTLNLALEQRRLGHTVWLAFDRKRGNFNGYEEGAAERLTPHNLQPPLPLTLSAKSTPLEIWRDIRALRAFCRAGDVDVLHMHLSHDHTLASFLGHLPLRRIRTVHAARSLTRRPGQRWLNGRADAWIVRCSRHREALRRNLAPSAGPVQVIAGSIDCTAFAPPSPALRAASRKALGIPDAVPLVGHVALLAQRGQQELLQALSQCEMAQALLVGRGESEASLRAQVDALGLQGRVHFAGYLQGDALLQAYAAMDVAFLAQAGNDGSARAALEAMASGLPLMAVRQDALADLVNDMVGYPIEARDTSHIATSLRAWLADMQGGRAKGAAARVYVSTERRITDEARQTLQAYRATDARVEPPCANIHV